MPEIKKNIEDTDIREIAADFLEVAKTFARNLDFKTNTSEREKDFGVRSFVSTLAGLGDDLQAGIGPDRWLDFIKNALEKIVKKEVVLDVGRCSDKQKLNIYSRFSKLEKAAIMMKESKEIEMMVVTPAKYEIQGIQIKAQEAQEKFIQEAIEMSGLIQGFVKSNFKQNQSTISKEAFYIEDYEPHSDDLLGVDVSKVVEKGIREIYLSEPFFNRFATSLEESSKRFKKVDLLESSLSHLNGDKSLAVRERSMNDLCNFFGDCINVLQEGEKTRSIGISRATSELFVKLDGEDLAKMEGKLAIVKQLKDDFVESNRMISRAQDIARG